MAETSYTLPAASTPPRFRSWLSAASKRLLDVVVSLLGLILLSPVFIVIAWYIKRDSPGLVFYRGPRLGKGGKTFHILKFRTMHAVPESYDGLRITAQDDPRVTPLGRWLRDTKLNELPQLWNVLKGEMSLVGPRPEDPDIAKDWSADVRREVLSMAPGVTSPASVLYRNEESLLKLGNAMEAYLDDILPSKLRLDQLYIRHHSLWLDLDILFWTFIVLIPLIKRYAPPEEMLFWGPVSRLGRRHLSWYAVDTLITLVCIGLTGLFWRPFEVLNVGWLPAVGLALGFALLFTLVNVLTGVNRIDWSRSPASDILDLLPGVALATFLALSFNFIIPASWLSIPQTGRVTFYGIVALLPPGLILIAAALSSLGFVITRYRSRLITGLASRWVTWRGAKSIAGERVLIVGGGDTGQFAAWILNNGHYSGSFKVVGFVDDDLYKKGTRIGGTNVLGNRVDVPQLVIKHDIGIIVFAIHNITSAERDSLLEICSKTSAKLFLFPDILAALSSYSRNGQEQRKQTMEASSLLKGRDDIDIGKLPCFLCLTQVTPLKVDGWLSQLEETAQSGEDVIRHIRLLRSYIHDAAAVQLNANLGGEDE